METQDDALPDEITIKTQDFDEKLTDVSAALEEMQSQTNKINDEACKS